MPDTIPVTDGAAITLPARVASLGLGMMRVLATCEALRAGQAFGREAELMTDVLDASTGRNNSTGVKLKPFVIPRSYATGLSMALMVKDLRTADELVRQRRVAAPLSHAATALWSRVDGVLGIDAEHTAIDRFLEEIADEDA